MSAARIAARRRVEAVAGAGLPWAKIEHHFYHNSLMVHAGAVIHQAHSCLTSTCRSSVSWAGSGISRAVFRGRTRVVPSLGLGRSRVTAECRRPFRHVHPRGIEGAQRRTLEGDQSRKVCAAARSRSPSASLKPKPISARNGKFESSPLQRRVHVSIAIGTITARTNEDTCLQVSRQ